MFLSNPENKLNKLFGGGGVFWGVGEEGPVGDLLIIWQRERPTFLCVFSASHEDMLKFISFAQVVSGPV